MPFCLTARTANRANTPRDVKVYMRRKMRHVRLCVLCALTLSAAAPADAQKQKSRPADSRVKGPSRTADKAPPRKPDQKSNLRGTYSLDRSASDDVDGAIEETVAQLSFFTRPFARERLRKLNRPYQRLTVGYTAQEVSITVDESPPIRTPLNGTAVKWSQPDGENFEVTAGWEDGSIVQTFEAEDGRRVNLYTLEPDGNMLRLNVTLISPQLAAPLKYKLLYKRNT